MHHSREDSSGRVISRRRHFYLTTHNTRNRQSSIPSVGFEPTNPASELPQTHALDREATEIGCGLCYNVKELQNIRSIVTPSTSAKNSLHMAAGVYWKGLTIVRFWCNFNMLLYWSVVALNN